MEITQVVVGIHEKRNHPHEYGHYDASVTFTATLESGEDADTMTAYLRGRARGHVLSECDEWEEMVKEEQRIAQAIGNFNYNISQFQWQTEKRVEECNEIIAELPEEMQAEYRQRLEEAIDQLPPMEEPPEDGYYEDEEEIEF